MITRVMIVMMMIVMLMMMMMIFIIILLGEIDYLDFTIVRESTQTVVDVA